MAAAVAIVQGILHPDWSMICSLAHDGVPWLLYETFCIAFLGTLGGTVIAAWFFHGQLSSLSCTGGTDLPADTAIDPRCSRLCVRPDVDPRHRPGPFAGVLTLTLCSVGLLAKRFLIAIDDIQLEPYRAYRAMGDFYRAVHPLGCPAPAGTALRAAILYRFDVNLRDAAILGLVGAGGIGTPLILAMMHYEWAAAGALLWGMVGIGDHRRSIFGMAAKNSGFNQLICREQSGQIFPYGSCPDFSAKQSAGLSAAGEDSVPFVHKDLLFDR